MLWKLSFNGIKSRFKDYLVLFLGLVISSTVFYLFLSLIMNPVFLKSNMPVTLSMTQFIFGFGAVLLGIITLAYVNFANRFLLSMRKKDYGTYLMLGAKSRKIGNLIFTETLITGAISTLAGIVLGIFASQGVTVLLMKMVKIKLKSFSPVVPTAILLTFAFYLLVFFFAALFNRIKLVRTPVIKLLREEQSPVNVSHKKFLRVIFGLLGIGLLATGYIILFKQSLDVKLIVTSLFTISFGSYFLFKASLGLLIDLLRRYHKLEYKNLRAFTLGQLKFRLEEYTQILSVISIFFALALGAITVGLRFESYKSTYSATVYYDAAILKKTPKTEALLKQISGKREFNYNYKIGKHYVYFEKAEFEKQPFINKVYDTKKISSQSEAVTNLKTVKLTAKKSDVEQMNYLLQSLIGINKEIKFVSASNYQKVAGTVKQLTLIKTKNMVANYEKLLEVIKIQNPYPDELPPLTPMAYQMVTSLVSGFEFMGFFLGFAFLAMLASTLMFKVLTGAEKDRIRYQMIGKIGFRTKQIKRAIRHEVGALFFLPAILGICHVLVGLQLFKKIVISPYQDFWIPLLIFLVLYSIYYLVTVKLYQGIVLKKL